MLRIGGSKNDVYATSSSLDGHTVAGLNIAIDLSIENEGQSVAVMYTVENTTGAPITYDLASGSDIQIGSDDSATITSFVGDTGFKMVSDNIYNDENSEGEFAQFNMFLKGYEGITAVSGYWYGDYNYVSSNYFIDKTPKTEYSDDSGAAWHWADKTIADGATQVYTIKMGIGGAGSENVLGENEYNVAGRVVDQNETPLENITVTLTEGKTATTDADGKYTIEAVKKSVYAVAMSDGTNTQTTTVVVNAASNEDILSLGDMVFVVDAQKNTTVDTGTGVPPVGAENLDTMFTEEDANKNVDITLKVEKNDDPVDKSQVDALVLGQNAVGMYCDISLLKSVDGGGATPI